MCPLSGRSPAQEPGAGSVLGKDLEIRELEKGNLRVSPPPPPAGAKAGVEKAPLRRWRWENCGCSSPKFAPARGDAMGTPLARLAAYSCSLLSTIPSSTGPARL